MGNKKGTTASLIGISHFSRNGLMTEKHGEIVYFIVQPTNISVLSETNIAIKINRLMQLLSTQPDIEIICSDARENFEQNKLNLAKRAEKKDIKRFLSKYFGHMVEDGIDDVDGERIIKKWMIPD